MALQNKAIQDPKRDPTGLKRRLIETAMIIVVGIAIVAMRPFPYDERVLTLTVIYAMAGIGLNVLIGYTGIVSLGHAAFLLFGAYGWALLSQHTPGAVAIVLSLLFGVAVAWALGLLCLRFRGYILAAATISFGMLMWAITKNWDSLTGGNNGISGIGRFGLPFVSSSVAVYLIVLIFLAAFYWLQEGLRASRLGMSMLASRSNEEGTASMGISISRIRVIAFVISAIPTIIAGVFLAQLTTYINPNQFEIPTSVSLIAIPIIGGRGWRWAPLIGAVFVIALPEYVRFLANYRLVIYGLILTTITLFFPDGFRQLFQGLSSLWTRRNEVVAGSHEVSPVSRIK